MFDSFRKAEVTPVAGPDGGPAGYVHQVVQGNTVHEQFPATQYALAAEMATNINDEVLRKNPRRIAVIAFASSAVVAAVVAGGFTAFARTEQPSPDSPEANAPVPAETRFVTSTATEFVTETPKPVIKTRVKRVEVTVHPKTHHRHHTATNTSAHENPIPQAPASSYTPPQVTYTAPSGASAAKPTHHAPSFTVHHLREN